MSRSPHAIVLASSLFALTFAAVACGGRVSGDGSSGKGALGGSGGDPAPSASSGSGSSSGSSGSSGTAVDAGPPTCGSPTYGGFGGSECKSYGDLLAQAESACASSGAKLAAMTPTPTDYCGGEFRYRDFTCCAPGGGDCVARTDGGDTSCKSYETWKKYSDDDCAAEGRVLSALSVSVPCAPDTDLSASGATYTCCAP